MVRTYGADSDEARVGATVAIRAMRHAGGTPVRAALAALRALPPDAAAVVRTEQGYVATTAARMDYPALAAQGLPLASARARWRRARGRSSSTG